MSRRLNEGARTLLMVLGLMLGPAHGDSGMPVTDCQRLSGALPAGTHWLEVHQLGAPLGRIVAMTLQVDGRWAMQARDLARLRVATALEQAPDRWLVLDEIPALSYTLDPCRLILTLDLREVSRPHQQIRYQGGASPAAVDPVARSISLQISPRSEFDRLWRHSGNLRLLGAGPSGRWLSEWLHDSKRWHRLDTRWVREWPQSHLQLTVGDTVSHAASWGRPLRFAGLQLGTDHGLDPFFVTYPLPGIRGSAAVPSIADLYVNGARQPATRVEGGAFNISEVPAVSGAGELQVQVRDLAGRTVSFSQPYYVAPELLRPGLLSWNAELGRLREFQGTDADRYGAVYAGLGMRQGVTDTVTWGLRLEAVPQHPVVGTSLEWLWPSWGLWSATLAASDQEQPGAQAQLAFSRTTQRWNVAGSQQWRDAHYRAMGEEGAGLRRETRIRLGRSGVLGGSLFASHIDQHRSDQQQAISTLGWGRALPRLGGVLNLQWQRLRGDSHDDRVLLNLSLPLAHRRLLALSSQSSRSDSGLLQATWAQPRRGLLGGAWRLTAEHGLIDRFRGDLMWSGRGGELRAFSSFGLSDGVAFEADTEWTLSAGGQHWGRQSAGARALVQTGLPDLRVYLDNRLAGRTDEQGALMLTGLRPYEVNRIHVEPDDLPIDRHISRTNAQVVPPRDALVTVQLATGASRSGLIRLLLADGHAVPAEALVRSEHDASPLLSDLDARFYLPDYREGALVTAQWAGNHCRVRLPRWAPMQHLNCLPETGS